MRRKILGVVAATIAAPYLVLAFYYVGDVLLRSGGGLRRDDLFGVRKILPLGLDFLLYLGGPLVAAAGLLAFVLERFGLRHRAVFIAAGALLGAAFVATTSPSHAGAPESWSWGPVRMIAPFAGAICGFIYWRIGVRETPSLSAATRLDPTG